MLNQRAFGCRLHAARRSVGIGVPGEATHSRLREAPEGAYADAGGLGRLADGFAIPLLEGLADGLAADAFAADALAEVDFGDRAFVDLDAGFFAARRGRFGRSLPIPGMAATPFSTTVPATSAATPAAVPATSTTVLATAPTPLPTFFSIFPGCMRFPPARFLTALKCKMPTTLPGCVSAGEATNVRSAHPVTAPELRRPWRYRESAGSGRLAAAPDEYQPIALPLLAGPGAGLGSQSLASCE